MVFLSESIIMQVIRLIWDPVRQNHLGWGYPWWQRVATSIYLALSKSNLKCIFMVNIMQLSYMNFFILLRICKYFLQILEAGIQGSKCSAIILFI